MPAHDRRGEGDQPGLEALEVPHVGLIQRVHKPGGAGQHPPDQEGQRDREIDVDAHQPGRLGILGRGPHGPARAGCW